MGQAKQRGTFEERRAQSIERQQAATAARIKRDDDMNDRREAAGLPPLRRSRMPPLFAAALTSAFPYTR